MTGTVYSVAPIPPDDAHTTYVDAGVLRIGVEHRLLNDAELAANYSGEDMAEIQAATRGQAVQDNGVSIHVFGARDSHEYLRFDMFAQAPHYHYIEPSGSKQTIVEYDRVALGDMLPWTINQLNTRLVEMLVFAGGAAVAAEVDSRRISDCLAEVGKLAGKAEEVLRAQREN